MQGRASPPGPTPKALGLEGRGCGKRLSRFFLAANRYVRWDKPIGAFTKRDGLLAPRGGAMLREGEAPAEPAGNGSAGASPSQVTMCLGEVVRNMFPAVSSPSPVINRWVRSMKYVYNRFLRLLPSGLPFHFYARQSLECSAFPGRARERG